MILAADKETMKAAAASRALTSGRVFSWAALEPRKDGGGKTPA